jgi:hypothetical protein
MSVQELWNYVHSNKPYTFDIESISNVKVWVKLLYINKQASFYIESRHNNETLFYEKLNSITELQHLLDVVLPSIEFSKKEGNFYSIHAKIYKPPVSFTHLINIPNMKMDYEPCCVCMEETSTKTVCNHPLCVECINELKKDVCPMCRHCVCDSHECNDCHPDEE